MFYVYFLVSELYPDKTYTGYTANDPFVRLEHHNSGGDTYTKQYRPWRIATYLAYDAEIKARRYEKYYKAGSGKAYANKHFFSSPLT